MKKTSLFENGIIWFGAAVSIAEILTGTYFAPLGFGKGVIAVVAGHIIGCVLMFLMGAVGGMTGKSSMESVKISFGKKGGLIFALLNILQLFGWTAVMIYDGAVAADGIFGFGTEIWSVVIGSLIAVWLLCGIKNLGKINTIAVAGLFILTIVLSVAVFSGEGDSLINYESISFGAAVELAAAMPLSWLPLISDYTKDAQKPVKASAVSAIVYGAVSCWMYVIGMGAAVIAGTSDMAQLILRAGIGSAGLIIVVFSTVTTTFLDAYSAGISSESVFPTVSGKGIAVAVCAIGTISAICFPVVDLTDFLYLIGSVFAPATAVLLTDYYILKKDNSHVQISFKNIFVWIAGFVIYRLLMKFDIPVGNTLPDMVITSLLSMVINKII